MEDKNGLQDFRRIKSFAFERFETFGYSNEQLEKEFFSWDIKDLNVNHLKDSIWFFFNRLIWEFPHDFQTQAQIYWSMAIFDLDYGNGKAVNVMKKLSADARIHHFESTHKENDIIQYIGRILVSKGSCAACMIDKERKFNVKELFQSHPLPDKDCTCRGVGCTCMIGFEANRDDNGRLIFDLDNLDSKQETRKK